jgi:hypothetical protein
VDFAERAGARHITTELALAWARQPQDAHPHRWRQRLGMVRAFARYVAMIDPSSEVPAEDLLPATRQRVPPYIYSQDEIAALMQAAKALKPPLRAATFSTKRRRQPRFHPVEAADQVDVRRMDGRGIERDDYVIATGNGRRLGHKRHELGRLAEAGQLQGGHRMISSDGPAVEQLMMHTFGSAPRFSGDGRAVTCSAPHRKAAGSQTRRPRAWLFPTPKRRS